MPRLLRIHFASIGHRDARLSPLTLDFRDRQGGAADSVLWLRNGGGKSSIINLFFSIFRPHRSEFLGAAAEGKARRIEHYVKATDVAFAVTEWDLGEEVTSESEEGKARGAQQRYVVGRVLAWKGQTQTADPSKLRRVFFSFRADPDTDLAFEQLPILGLGSPATSLDSFRTWLREQSNTHAAAHVVYTENQRQWNEHLERLHLDPELFRYQIRMNLREGAADEAFRFGTALDFIHFLLELAFDAAPAEQLAKNLQDLRDQFARRPALELEHNFIVQALAALRPMVAAVREHTLAHQTLHQSLSDIAAFTYGLRAQAATLADSARSALASAVEAAERGRAVSNERDKRRRWSRGLEHLALRLDVDEKQARCYEIDDHQRRVDNKRRMLLAATSKQQLDRLDAELTGLREALRRAEAKLAPERNQIESAGSTLRAALTRESDRVTEWIDDLSGRIEIAEGLRDKKQRQIEELRECVARLGERLVGLKQAISKRDTARERLQKDGWVTPRESIPVAQDRWKHACERASSRREQTAREVAAVHQKIADARHRQRVVTGDLARFEQTQKQQDEALARAMDWRQALCQNQCIVEMEAVDDPDLENQGLEGRLRAEAATAATSILKEHVDRAEDDRSLQGLESTGLLPPPRDVERVTQVLRDRSSLNAHSGTAYLAETVPVSERIQWLQSDPARFGGVIVVASELSAQVADATDKLDLRSPVQVSVISSDSPPVEDTPHVEDSPPVEDSVSADGTANQHHVVSPNPATYDYAQAESTRGVIQERQQASERRIATLRSRQRDFEKAADELQRYLDDWGRGQLDALQQSRDAIAEQAALAQSELAALATQEQQYQAAALDLESQQQQAVADLTRAERAEAALDLFWNDHEAAIESLRSQRESAEKQIRYAQRELAGNARDELHAARKQLDTLIDQKKDCQRDWAALGQEAAQIAYLLRQEAQQEGPQEARPAIPLDQARDRYRHLLANWEHRTSDNRLQWQIEDITTRAAPIRKQFAERSAEFEQGSISELARLPDLDQQMAATQLALDKWRGRHAKAVARLEVAQTQLSQSKGRRDAQDLPPATDDQPTPTTAAAASAAADEMRVAVQEFVELARQEEEQEQRQRQEAARFERSSERYLSLAGTLAALVQGAGLELPPVAIASLPQSQEAIDTQISDVSSRFTAAKQRLLTAEAARRKTADQVRSVATAPSFSALRSQARERMNADTHELCQDCERIATQLAPRLDIIRDHLDEIDKDRQILVGALQKIGAEAGQLLRRAQRASVLPQTLGAWAGKPYLRIRFNFPETDVEQRSRLDPLVDRLVQKAHIPSGLELVKLAIAELAGARGFEAKILKPDAVLRPEPISIVAMNTFSRGQQLTAAILLYCTLVQLRARTRGRGHGPANAGILLLDNPIGTCSSVPLLELQRAIAKEMRVQLIYATGVDDLEALETLPNKIRLRNTMRDRSSGDFHVTPEAQVEAVRIARTGS